MSKLSSSEKILHQQFKHFGLLHLQYRRKCIGLIPQIFTQKIYQKKGYSSICEYAAKLAGLSQKQVKRVLYLAEKFEDKTLLKKVLESGEIGTGKLAKIASIVTVENQGFWLNQTRILNTRALEVLVRDERLAIAKKNESENFDGEILERNSQIFEANSQTLIFKNDDQHFSEDKNFSEANTHNKSMASENQNSLLEPKNDNNFVHVNKSRMENENMEMQISTSEKPGICTAKRPTIFDSPKITIQKLIELNLDQKVVEKLTELKQKGLNINEILLELLQQREEEIIQEKEKISEDILQEHQRETTAKNTQINDNIWQKINSNQQKTTDNKKPSHYIKIATKKILQKEYGEKCSIASCNKLAKPTHHSQRFGLAHYHDPKFMAPLCQEHHQIAHSIDIAYQEIKGRR